MSPLVRVETALARALLALPPPLLRLLAGRPIERDGRVLDPQVQLILRASRLARKRPSHELGVARAREDLDVSGVQLAPRVRDVTSRDTAIAGVPVRVYAPRALGGAAIVYFHGGGHTSGSLASHDGVCRAMASSSGALVVAVDYRRAPEHPFPAAADDATAVFRALASGALEAPLDPTRIAVAGDSAGANLAAVVALDTIDDAVRPRAQLLVYPVVDLTMSFPSVATLGHGFMLERDTIAWYRDNYLGALLDAADDDAARARVLRHPRASPYFAPDEQLARTPPAIVVTAGFDPLRDEGDAFAAKLARLGVRVHHLTYDGLWHGFWNTTGCIRAAKGAFDDAMALVIQALGGSPARP